MMRQLIVICSVLLLFILPVQSQGVYFNSITTAQGLSNNSVHTIVSDDVGQLWIGTWDGITLFDGIKFTVLKHDVNNINSVAGNNVQAIVKAVNSDMWVISESQKISRLPFNALQQDFDQQYSPYNFIHYDIGAHPVSLFENEDQQIEVVLQDQSHLIYDSISDTFIATKAPRLQQKAVLSPKEHIQAAFKKDNTLEVVNAVLSIGAGHFYVATQYSGLYVVELDKANNVIQKGHYVRNSGHSQGLLSNEVTCLFQDSSNRVWLGLKDGGIALVQDHNSLISLVSAQSMEQPYLPEQSVRAITKDNQGGYYLGYYTQGVYYAAKKGQTFKPLVLQQAKDNANWLRVRSLYTDTHNNVWVGSYAGVVKIQANKQTYFTQSSTANFFGDRTYGFAMQNNYLWVAGFNGLSRYNYHTSNFEDFLAQDKLAQYAFRSISVAGPLLYLSTEKHGVIIYDSHSGQIKSLTTSQGLMGNSVYRVYVDPISKYIWIASLGGITILDHNYKVVTQLTEKQGLPSHLVYSLNAIEDKVWLSTSKGVAYVDKKTFKVLDYSSLPGWQGIEFAEGASFQSEQGQLVYAGHNGINFFSAADFRASGQPKFKLWLNQGLVSGTEKLIFDKNTDHLQMQLYPLGFDFYGVNEFEYRVVGLFDEFRVLPFDVVFLDGLSFGEYEIQIRPAIDPQKGLVFTKGFTIARPWYYNPYFYLAFLLLVGAAIKGLFVFEKAKQARIKKQLEQGIATKTLEIKQQKELLSLQNKELIQGKSDIEKKNNDLIALHSKLKSSDIEVEQLRAYVLSTVQGPLLGMLQHIRAQEPVDVQLLENKIVLLYDTLRSWDYVLDKDLEHPVLRCSVEIQSYSAFLFNQSLSFCKKYPIELVVENQLPLLWVEIDVMHLKLLYLYVVYECVKWIQDQELRVCFEVDEQALYLTFRSDCARLCQNWKQNEVYSYYFKAIKSILNKLGGSYTANLEGNFEFSMALPIIKTQSPSTPSVDYTHFLEQLDTLDQQEVNILVYTNVYEKSSLEHILGTPIQTNFIYCHSKSDLMHYIDTYKFDALIVYDMVIDQGLALLMGQIKKASNKDHFLLVYMSVQVDYYNEQQLFEWGVHEVIDLPVRQQIIKSKLFDRIARQKKQTQNASALEVIVRGKQNTTTPLSYDQKLLQKGLACIENALGDACFDMQQLSDSLGISKMKCYRLFKHFLDKPALEVLGQMRMERASVLLQQNTLSIAEVSDACGYNDPKYFSKSFKKYHGVSPSTFQQNHALTQN